MKKLIAIAGLIAAHCLAQAQTAVLYQEDFGTTGGGTTLAAVGWKQVLPPSGYSGIYAQSGAVDGTSALSLPAGTLYFGGNAGTGVYFTTNTAGSGTGGDSAFTSIDPTLYTNLNISIESQYSYQGANLKCWFAVQVGGAWFVDTNSLITTAGHSSGAIFYQSGITYNPASTNWNILTNTTVAVIGPPSSTNLSGVITGIGIVNKLSAAGSWDYNNLLITSISNPVVQIPTLTYAPISQENYAGAGVSFSVGALGATPLTYIWQTNGVAITNNSRVSGANTATLTIQNIGSADALTYSVIVSNSAGYFNSATNATTTLTVDPLPADYLYAETFPFVGPQPVNFPLSNVGWSNSIADNPYRLLQVSGGYGATYAFEGAATTTAFYTTTNSDTGVSGLAFPVITPSSYPAVAFSVNIAPAYLPTHVTAYFAVQMDGGNWYAMTQPIPVNTSSASTSYTTYQQPFNPYAGNWNSLTLSATGASIGATAASNLNGNITGAGLVTVYTGTGGTFDFNNFLILTDAVAGTPATIVLSPLSQTAYAGGGVSFAGTATGSQPLTYYWQFNGNPVVNGGGISGANSNVLTILNVNSGDAGQYTLIASNSTGTDSSANYVTTTLTVNALPPDYLYAETFPFVGPQVVSDPLSFVGWSNSIGANLGRLYQISGGNGAFYAYESSAVTSAFYTTTNSDTGVSGLPFPVITPSLYPAVAFSVDVAPAYLPAHVTAYFAVQMDGSNWYSYSTPIPVNTSTASATFTTYQQPFTTDAASWNNLTLYATNAQIGATAATSLTGNITGAGLVVVYTGTGGTFDFQNFLVLTDAVAGTPPTITASPFSQTVYAGAGVSLAGTASGSPPLTYYWQLNGNPVVNGGGISGANSNVLTILNVNSGDAGQYTLIASNSTSTDSSANYVATELTVNPLPANLLYAETFPYVGPVVQNDPLGLVGWVNSTPDYPGRLFQTAGGDGAVYSYETASTTTAYYATTASDTGASGLPFPAIYISSTNQLTFAVDIAPTVTPTNITASLAVQINGGNWYVSATNLPVNNSTVSATYTTVSQVFQPAAANWNILTLNSTNAVAGAPAGAALSGNITGAGLVFKFTGGGNFNFDNFQITSAEVAGPVNPGNITVASLTGASLTLNWTASPGVQLQSTTNLVPPVVWTNVSGTAGQSSATISTTGGQMFFQLISQ